MRRQVATRSQKGILAPVSFVVGSLGVWAAVAAGCAKAPEDPAVLARVDQTEIRTEDLRAFEEKLPANGTPGPDDHQANLQTLIDRELLLLEARARGLEQDPQVLEKLAGREAGRLAEVVMKQLYERATVSEEEIRHAYDGAWNTQVVTQQIFVPSAAQAREVAGLVRQGRDFVQLARQYAVDRVLRVPLGSPEGASYSPYDGPQEVVLAVFALPVGGTTQPIQVKGGYVIARVTQRRHVGLEDIRDRITEWLTTTKKRELRAEYLKELKADFNLTFSPQAMDLVVQVLRGEARMEDLGEEQRRLPVYLYGEEQMAVEEVLERIAPAARRWREINHERVITELKERVLPVAVVAMDARRQGVDQVPAYQEWRQAEKERLALVRLQALVVGKDSLQVTPAELDAYYQTNKQRYRIPAWARLQELLVEDADQARALAASIAGGADMAALVRRHSVRQVGKDGVLTVYGPQAQVYGEAWMNLAMSAPLGQVQGPVQTKGGYSVFRVLERQPEGHYGLDQRRVRRDVETGVEAEKARTRFNEYLNDLRRRNASRVRTYRDHLEMLVTPARAESARAPS